MIYLTWAKSVPKGYACHVLRREMRGRVPCPLHTHDFYEVFWIEQGEGLHLINDRKIPVRRGTVVMMRASDRHGFRMRNPNSFTVLNVAFTQDTLHFLRDRYFLSETRFFWASTELPYQMTLGLKQLRWLTRWAEYVAKQPYTRLRVERFLLDLLSEFADASPLPQHDTCPDWLRDAMERIRDPRHFASGTRQLARLAGRSPEHLTRELRRHFSEKEILELMMMTGQYIGFGRMLAALQLETVSCPI